MPRIDFLSLTIAVVVGVSSGVYIFNRPLQQHAIEQGYIKPEVENDNTATTASTSTSATEHDGQEETCKKE